MSIAGLQSELLPPEPGTGARAGERFIVTRDQLATILDLKPQTVNKLVTDGMPKLTHGRYDLAAAVQWYVESWRQRANDRAPSDTNERKRYDAARATRAELELAERRRELIGIDEVRQVVTRVVAILVAGLEALPARAAPELAARATAGDCHALLEEHTHGIRSDIGAALGDLGRDPGGAGAGKPATAAKRRRVGRRKAPAA